MIIQEFKKTGTTERELTPTELQQYAEDGNDQAKKEIFNTELTAAKTTEERLTAIEKRLQ